MTVNTSEMLRAELRALADAVRVAPGAAARDGGGETPAPAATVALVDRLLGRVAALTESLPASGERLDDVSTVTARLLLADLSLITAAWQTLGGVTGRQLEAADAALADGGAVIDRLLREASAQERPGDQS